MYNSTIKIAVDKIVSLSGLLILSPVFIFTIILLAFANGGKAFFFQIRPGKDEKAFKLIKFKTMNDKTDVNGKLLEDKDRLTKVGQWVRRLSLDEIPQLLNVLKGDMSLIGPRPLLMEYLPLYNEEQKRRHTVRPGITGWAQVNGRNTISWEKKFEYDIWYVDNASVLVDLKIALKTILKVLKVEGISSESSVTMEKFKGTKA